MTFVQIDAIKEYFPITVLDTIIGKPTYESISKLKLQLNVNAASIETSVGTGLHKHLALTIPTDDFNTLNIGTDWVASTNPRSAPTMAASATGQQITEANRVHAIILK